MTMDHANPMDWLFVLPLIQLFGLRYVMAATDGKHFWLKIQIKKRLVRAGSRDGDHLDPLSLRLGIVRAQPVRLLACRNRPVEQRQRDLLPEDPGLRDLVAVTVASSGNPRHCPHVARPAQLQRGDALGQGLHICRLIEISRRKSRRSWALCPFMPLSAAFSVS